MADDSPQHPPDPRPEKRGWFHQVKHRAWHPALTRLRNKLIAGLAFAIPLVATFWILSVVFRFLQNVSDPLVRLTATGLNFITGRSGTPEAFTEETFVLKLGDFEVNIVGLLILVWLLIFLGGFATHVIGRRILAWFDALLLGVPIVGFIYKSLKQVIDAFHSIGAPQSFKRVVFIEYPAPGCRLLGFVTGQFFDKDSGKNVTSVFVPTAPNPISGFVVLVDDDRVIDSTITLEDATKMIFSAGLVAPGSTPVGGKPRSQPVSEESKPASHEAPGDSAPVRSSVGESDQP